jgi:signal transduction histidine kinase
LLERAYARLGHRYIYAYIATWILGAAIMVLVATLIFSIYQDMSIGRFLETLVFAEVAIVVSLGIGAWRVTRRAAPLQRWLNAGRPPEGAEEAWRAALGYAPQGVRTQFLLAVALVAVPVTLFIHFEFSHSWGTSALFLIGLIAAATYPTMVSFFLTEIVMQPVARDAARMLPLTGDPPATGVTLRTRLLVAMPLIGLVTTGFASVVSTIAVGGSIDQLGADVAFGVLVASTTSLGLAWLVGSALLGPIGALVDATRRLRSGDLGVRVPIVNSDELGTLTGSFNEMVEALSDREALRARASALELEADRLERQSERVRLDERARIARELHDVIAHNVGMIVLQADGAASMLEADPERVRGALDAIAGSGRQALGELRELLGVLRRSGGQELTPQPVLRDLEALAEEARAAGLDVDLKLSLDGGVPQALELSAYRIVQESLTNVIKHAGASQVAVEITWTGDALELLVSDDGAGPGRGYRSAESDGHGLIGMRERAVLLGGTLEAGPDPGNRGFAVRARLPVESG